MKKSFLIFLISLVLLLGVASTTVSAENMTYLNNSVIKIGVDLDKGGSITFLANASDGINIVNIHDLGRMIQQSYYSGPSPFEGGYWGGQDWPWNPIGAGDSNDNPSHVIEYSNDGATLYVKTRPKQWALNNYSCNCTFEKWITLEGNVAKVRARLNNNRTDYTDQYRHFGQELPAVYTTDEFYRLFTYNGSAPFTNASLTQINKSGPPWASWEATENWAALVRDGDNWGVGVFHPGVQTVNGGFYGTPNDGGGPTGDSTGHISPRRDEIIDWNIVYTYEYYLILNDLDGIRDYVYQYNQDHPNENLPDYRFEQDRQHWHYQVNGSDINYSLTTDAGWPIEGKLRVNLDQYLNKMFSPPGLWNATDVPVLYVRASYNTTNTTARIGWEKFGETGFSAAVYWNITPDGKFHTYLVNLSSNENYSGMIRRLRFDPVVGGGPGEVVDIEYISYTYTISLNSGWNLISIPLEQDNWNITSVLAPIDGNYSVVFAYIDDVWEKSTAARDPLTNMSLEYGYWIYMSASDTLELSGTVPNSTTINIVGPRWNLVGYPSFATRNITDVLSGCNYKVVFAYIDEVWEMTTAARDPLTNMTTGLGYWIYANEACSYEVGNQESGEEDGGDSESESDEGTDSGEGDPLPPATPTELNLNLSNPNGSNIDTSLLLTIDYLDSDSNPESWNSVNDSDKIDWGTYLGKSNVYSRVSAKDGTDINITVDGYEPLNVTADEGGYISGDYNLTLLPSINITSPLNTTTSDTTPDLNFTINKLANTTYNWDSEGNISGCRNCTSYSTTYGESNGSDANLSLLLHLNEGTGCYAYDSSSNGNNGTRGTDCSDPMLPSWTTGKFGNALEFEESGDLLNVSDDASLDIDYGDNLTIMAWIKTTPGSTNDMIVNKLNCGNCDGYHFFVSGGGAKAMIHDVDSGNNFGTGQTTKTVNDGQWHHVAFVINWTGSGKGHIYVDGELNRTSPQNITDKINSSFTTNAEPFEIGSMYHPSYNFSGTIDDLQVIRRALTAAEIEGHYNKTLSVGQHSVTVYAIDAEDNQNSTTRYFTIG